VLSFDKIKETLSKKYNYQHVDWNLVEKTLEIEGHIKRAQDLTKES
jgi:hypothetical protein